MKIKTIGEMRIDELEKILSGFNSDYKLERKVFVSLIKDKN